MECCSLVEGIQQIILKIIKLITGTKKNNTSHTGKFAERKRRTVSAQPI